MLVKLSQYIRSCIYRHIRPIYILDHCEKCGDDKNLHLHHERQFADMLNEALERLNIEYKIYKNEYTDDELTNIKYMMYGIHIDSNYVTLCEKCHEEIHKNGNGKDIYNFLKKEKEVKEEIIEDKTFLCAVTSNNIYTYECDRFMFKEQKRKGRGINLKNDNNHWIKLRNHIDINGKVLFFGEINLLDEIIIFYSDGKFNKTNLYKIKEEVNYFHDKKDIVKIIKMEDINKFKYFINISKYGFIKKTTVDSIIKVVENKNIITKYSSLYSSDDKIVNIKLCNDDDDEYGIIIQTKKSLCLNMKMNEIKLYNREAKGIKSIDLDSGDEVVDCNIYKLDDKKYIKNIVLTNNGYIKQTVMEEYKFLKRGARGLLNYKIEQNDTYIIGSVLIDIRNNNLISVWNKNRIITFNCNELSDTLRQTQGVVIFEKENIIDGFQLNLFTKKM